MSWLRLTALASALVFGLSLSACEQPAGDCSMAETDRIDVILELTPESAAGSGSFTNYCGSSGCHGGNGDSGPAPNLSREADGFTDDELLCLLLSGYGDMPSQETLNDQQLADILAYVRATF